MIFSVFAYIWLLVILVLVSPMKVQFIQNLLNLQIYTQRVLLSNAQIYTDLSKSYVWFGWFLKNFF